MNNVHESRKFTRIILMLIALIIGIVTLYLSQLLIIKIAGEEKKKIEIWAEAQSILTDPNTEGDLGFQLRVVQSNTTIPVILVDENNKIKQTLNIETLGKTNVDQFLLQKLEEFKAVNDPILVPVAGNEIDRLYFGESSVLSQLRYYPYLILGIVALFILVSYTAFSYSTRYDQNKIWVGLAKETAHQFGTPISSLMGWVEMIKIGKLPENAALEMRKDIDRLQIITERFSKIGSDPVLTPLELNAVMEESVHYMKNRAGKGVVFECNLSGYPILCNLNKNLFQWVIENLIKNSIDAMSGEGKLRCSVKQIKNKVVIDMIDNGKGIPRDQMKSVFKPGFTTKKRGWGLGLSLAKRIVTDYHSGMIYVEDSIPNQRTTMRIVLHVAEQPSPSKIVNKA
ncbi:MAG: ATP-binding protein [Flavobacteriales bacterium]|nr:MAG: ATP-binding protein [Flavobacteriales bacterium]